MGKIIIDIEEFIAQIRKEGEAGIAAFKECPSYQNFRSNVDMIGEEENFAYRRTIDAEHRRFHGELKRTAELHGRQDMLQVIIYHLIQLHNPDEERRTQEMIDHWNANRAEKNN